MPFLLGLRFVAAVLTATVGLATVFRRKSNT